MINDQIIWWIIKNKFVYLSNSIKEYILKNHGQNFEQQFKRIMKRLISQLGKTISQNLVQRKSVLLQNLVLFFPVEKIKIISQKQIKTMQASYQINGTLKSKMLIKNKSKYQVMFPINDNIAFQIASLMLVNLSIIQEMIVMIIRAINDLVGNGQVVQLDLLFCKMKISDKEIKCIFSKKFIQSLQLKIEEKKQNIKLCLCHGQHSQNSHLKSIKQIQQSINNKKWEQIKDGNLFNYPSLVQIKNHLDKGRILQMKYSEMNL